MQVTENVHLEIASLRKARLRVRCFGLRVWDCNVGEVLMMAVVIFTRTTILVLIVMILRVRTTTGIVMVIITIITEVIAMGGFR